MVIIVLGMHRSGTSMVSGLLQHLGVAMGRQLMEPNPANPKGFFEDRAFLLANQEILRTAGGRWFDPPSFEAIAAAGQDPGVVRRLDTLLAQRTGQTMWGFKDPRTCLTLPLYMERLSHEVRLVCTHRNALAIAKSIARRDFFSLEMGLQLAATYQVHRLHWLAHFCQVPRLHLSFEQLISDPTQVDALAAFLGLEPTPEARGFVDPSLSHQG